MVVADAGLLENRRAPTTTLEGWRSFINADPSELTLLPRDQWEALDERDRRDYDEARIAHHAELVVVTTSAIQEITGEGQMLVLMNQREIGARRGLIVSGDCGHRQDHQHQAARPPARTAGPGPVPGRAGPDPGRLRHLPAQGLAAQAGHGVRPVPRPAAARPGPTSPTSPMRSARSSSTPAPTWCWSMRSTTSTTAPRPGRTCPIT